MSEPYADAPILCPRCGEMDFQMAEVLRCRIRGLEERIEKLIATNGRTLTVLHDLEIEHGLRDDASGSKSPGPRCIYCQQTRAGTPDAPHLLLRNIWVCSPCKRAET
jgi:hypothetical protein